MAWLPHQQQQQYAYAPANVDPGNDHYAYANGGHHRRGHLTPEHGAETTELGKALDMASERVGSTEMKVNLRQRLRTGLSVGKGSTNGAVQKMGGDLREYTWHLEAFVFQGSLSVLAKVKVLFSILRGEDGAPVSALRHCLMAPQNRRALADATSAMRTACGNAKESEQHLLKLMDEAGITKEAFEAALAKKVDEITKTVKLKGRYHSAERFVEGAGVIAGTLSGVAGGAGGAGIVAFGVSTAVLLDIAGGCGAATVLFTLIALYAYCKRVKAKAKERRSKKEAQEIKEAVEEMASIVAALYGIEAMLVSVLSELDVILRELERYAADAADADPNRVNALVRQADWLYGRCTDFEAAVQYASDLVEAELKRTA